MDKPNIGLLDDAFLAQVREELVEMAKKFRKVSQRCEVLEQAKALGEQWSLGGPRALLA